MVDVLDVEHVLMKALYAGIITLPPTMRG